MEPTRSRAIDALAGDPLERRVAELEAHILQLERMIYGSFLLLHKHSREEN